MDIIEKIVEAKDSGLTVMEIAKVLTWKYATVHEILMKSGSISPIRRDGKPPEAAIDARILKAMKAQGITFERWAKGFGFDLQEADMILGQPMDLDDDESVVLHRGLCADFFSEYRLVYGCIAILPLKLPRGKVTNYTYRIEWVREKYKYFCVITELDEQLDDKAPFGSGLTPELALASAQDSLKVWKQIGRLEKAIILKNDLMV